jgi:8-amino-7-oxononanoate synthase
MEELFAKAVNFTEHKVAKEAGYYPYFHPSSSQVAPRMQMDGRETIMLGSNNYMGLSCHPKMIKAAKNAIDGYGTGCTGSRLLNGTLDIHQKMEQELADFLGKELVISFPTGYMTNLGVISAITHKGEYVLSDQYNHASIIDGCRMSQAKTKVYEHQNMEDLERVLRELPRDAAKLIVSDGVFSMEGNIANVPRIIELAQQYDAAVMIDDAHGIGYLGEHGEGTCGYHKCMNDVDLVVGTFSKSFASIGGFAAGNEEIVEYLMHHARSFIFSASPPPAAVAAVREAIKIIRNGNELRKNVIANAERFRMGLNEIGYETGDSETPIVPVLIRKELKTFFLWKRLLKMGVYTNPVRAPAVPRGRELLRTSLMASHSNEDIDDALKIFNKAGRRLRVI